MAIITKIEEQKNKKRVNIFVDDAFFCGLNKETALIFKLKVGKEVDENVLKEAVFESEVKSAFEKSADYLSVRPHSKRELFNKLLKKGFEKQAIEKAIKKLEEYHFIDDEIYAKQVIEQNKKYSKRMLELKLREKGISSDIIQENFSDSDDNLEFEICKKQVEKLVKSKDMTKEGAMQKLFAALARKGFAFYVIKKATKAVINEDFEENDFSD